MGRERESQMVNFVLYDDKQKLSSREFEDVPSDADLAKEFNSWTPSTKGEVFAVLYKNEKPFRFVHGHIVNDEFVVAVRWCTMDGSTIYKFSV
jgi:hypothetical protein